MESVIAQLQRDRLRFLKNHAHLVTALREAESQADQLFHAIEKLGGDGSEEACQEAENAFLRKVNAPCEQESDTGRTVNERLGLILGR